MHSHSLGQAAVPGPGPSEGGRTEPWLCVISSFSKTERPLATTWSYLIVEVIEAQRWTGTVRKGPRWPLKPTLLVLHHVAHVLLSLGVACRHPHPTYILNPADGLVLTHSEPVTTTMSLCQGTRSASRGRKGERKRRLREGQTGGGHSVGSQALS